MRSNEERTQRMLERSFTVSEVQEWANRHPAIDIVGHGCSAWYSPLACYLREQDGGDWSVQDAGECWTFRRMFLCCSGTRYRSPLWAARVQEEVNRFCGGFWPVTAEQLGSMLERTCENHTSSLSSLQAVIQFLVAWYDGRVQP